MKRVLIKPTVRAIPTRGLIPLWDNYSHPGRLLRATVVDIDVEIISLPGVPPAPETCLDYCGRVTCHK